MAELESEDIEMLKGNVHNSRTLFIQMFCVDPKQFLLNNRLEVFQTETALKYNPVKQDYILLKNCSNSSED